MTLARNPGRIQSSSLCRRARGQLRSGHGRRIRGPHHALDNNRLRYKPKGYTDPPPESCRCAHAMGHSRESLW